jgi:hypothetical protein
MSNHAYSRWIEQKTPTYLHILNYATFFLQSTKYNEASFIGYENLYDSSATSILKDHLESLLRNYGVSQLERTRDLLKYCLEVEFFLMNGKFDEDHGLQY